MSVAIASGLYRQIIDHSERTPAVEVCGLLLGTADRIDAVVPAANVAPQPAAAFELDPETHFAALKAARAGGPNVIGHYHSHPNGRAEPSPCDAAMAHAGDYWMIVANGEARLFRADAGGRFVALALRCT